MPLTEQQMDARLKGLGGSDMAPVIAWYAGMPELSPWKQAQQLWLEKTGQLEDEEMSDDDVSALFFGSVLEAPIAEAYARRMGYKVRRVNRTLYQKDHPYILAHIDRAIERHPEGGLEVKNTGFHMGRFWGKDDTSEIALYHLAQVHTYLLVRDADWWDVAAYFGGGDLRVYRVERSLQWDMMIINAAQAFWDLVKTREAPGWDFAHPTTEQCLKTVYGIEEGKVIDLDADAYHWHKVHQDAQSKAKEYQTVAELAGNHLKSVIGDAAMARLPDGSGYTRKQVKRKGFTVDPTSYIDLRFKRSLTT